MWNICSVGQNWYNKTKRKHSEIEIYMSNRQSALKDSREKCAFTVILIT